MMLRVLLCVGCCNAPKVRPERRVVPRATNNNNNNNNNSEKASISENGQLISGSIDEQIKNQNNNSNKTANENDQLLANQIQANNESYGSKEANVAQGNLLTVAASKKSDDDGYDYDENEKGPHNEQQATMTELEGDSITASTSAMLFSDLAKGIEHPELSYEPSVTPPSSIDIEPFTERNSSRMDNENNNDHDDRQDQDDDGIGDHENVNDDYDTDKEARAAADATRRITDGHLVTRNAEDVPSTTKIGDYARLEYSPLEDLDSVTTISQSRGGSEPRGSRVSAPTSTKSGPNSTAATQASSRRSSQGAESTSISIASQLSNEHQQNLTNMLESAVPLFGTIGLPLGPPLEGSVTAKTSPETTGAALTSQDSLSDDDSLNVDTSPLTTSQAVSTGAALVDDSVELRPQAPLASKDELAKERIESPLSIATNTSGGLTNPTPTPSELSGGSPTKKKAKSKAKGLLKKFKVGGKKKDKSSPTPENK